MVQGGEPRGEIKGREAWICMLFFLMAKNHLKADVLPIGTKRAPLAGPQALHLLFYSEEYL